jgi:predicted GNAT superfamily acetyltransferase
MIRIRSCEGMAELDACVQLQIETWGYDATEAVPLKTFLLAQKIGGQVIGAFDSDIIHNNMAPDSGGVLVGFAMSLPGVKATPAGPQPYLHSHMLAVRPAHRNRGIGAQLKWEQRRDALARGIRRIEWTFDPLAIKNAFLNIHRLGAVARAYLVDFYGVSSSRLQGGLPTDRLLAQWELDSQRVEDRFVRRPAAARAIEERISVPASIDRWKADEGTREKALAVQQQNRRKFQQAFSQGLAALEFSLDAEGNGIYELGPYPEAR